MVDERDDQPERPAVPPKPKGPGAPDVSAGRAERGSVRPSAFGPPRAKSGPVGGPDSDAGGQATAEDTPDSQMASLEPLSMELDVHEPSAYDTAEASAGFGRLGPQQNVFPTLGYNPFRSADTPLAFGGHPLSDSADEDEGLTPGLAGPPVRDFEETEVTSPSLVAARSGLLPIPDDDEDLRVSSDPPSMQSSTGPVAVSLFAVMLLAALAVLVRQRACAPEQPVRVVLRSAGNASQNASPAAPEVSPDTPEAIVRRIEAGLPPSAHGAAEKLSAYAHSYLEEQRPDVADALFRRALRYDGEQLTAMVGLARLALARGEPEQALDWSLQAAQTEPQDASLHLLLGDALDAAGQTRRARTEWRKARSLDPGLPGLGERLGRRHGTR